jgi:superfamily II DNA or RNA helicase
MIVSPSEPHKIVFSLFSHEYLGYLVEGYVAQLNGRGEVSYKTQNISFKNLGEFEQGMDQDDKDLIQLTDNIQQEVIFKKFNTKKVAQGDFFLKTFDPIKGDKMLQESILSYVDNHKREIFSKIKTKNLFLMGNDGIATWKEIEIIQEPAKAYFHFDRLEDHTVYYPIIKCGEEKLKFQFKNAVIINDLPAAMLLDHKLFLFDQYADGKKLKPFLSKPNIIIPKKIEETYYTKFIVPLVASFNVFAKGFEIFLEKEEVSTQLIIKEVPQTGNQTLSLFDENTVGVNEGDKLKLFLKFNYGAFSFMYDTFSAPAYVKLEKKGDSWAFHKVKKNLGHEKNMIQKLNALGMNFRNGYLQAEKSEILNWLLENSAILEELGINIKQEFENNGAQYFLGYVKMDLKIEEKNDWFDVHALIQFGEFQIPFKQLKKYILNNIKEFILPNGQKAIIPASWFVRYSDLFSTIDIDTETGGKLKMVYIGMVHQLEKDGIATTILSKRLERLQDFKEIEEIDLPATFKGTLRPYQKAGYDWLHFLRHYKLGGCLADDMGLGKTVTTLAFLQKVNDENIGTPSLLLMPTSLIYNWVKEAKKFTPNLRVLVHFGPNRMRDCESFGMYDLIISSYGILRSDIEFIKYYKFEYAILDESQSIKNPNSNIFKAVIQLNTNNRLILTGTPLENSTLDLWSQFSFINPGLLGTERDFKIRYMQQIDKLKDEDALKNLSAKIKPFMLRRHKSQVAKDLPEKIETVTYCKMTEEQEKRYEETKSYVRNMIMSSEQNNNMLIIQGLTKMRQLANHPIMVDEHYEGESGKDNDVIHKLQEIVEQGHKTLVFSQFVKHLALISKRLNDMGIGFLYLDGTTKNRMELVEKFQNDAEPKVFLISLKAGGVGLNLTAAEYVFMLDPWWNPAVEAQAIDRAHRIGQTKTVFSYKFISQNTIEEKIMDLQNSKKELFNELILAEEGFLKALTQKDMLALLD